MTRAPWRAIYVVLALGAMPILFAAQVAGALGFLIAEGLSWVERRGWKGGGW